MGKFANWFEEKRLTEYANFGFEDYRQKKKNSSSKPSDELPMQPLNVEYITNLLGKKSYGPKIPIVDNYFGEVQWGISDGALQAKFSPLAGLNVSIRKMIHNLKGERVWICKKVVEIKNNYDEHPDKLHFLLDEVLKETDMMGLDMPDSNYKGLEKLIVQMAATLRRKTTQDIFMYEGIRVLEDDYKYLIHFGVTGEGRQRRGQKRLDQYAIHVTYNKDEGLIKITGTELGDKIDKYRWKYDPSTFIEYFSPYQKAEEIMDAILVHFNCY